MTARSEARARFDHETRLSLVEQDADELETGIAAVAERLSKILWALVGLLITVTTSSIFLALNLVVN